MSSGVAARAAEKRNHSENVGKQAGIVVETYHPWDLVFSTVASHLAVRTNATQT